MKENLQKIINNIKESRDTAETMAKYFRFQASKIEDEKLKAQANVQADSYEATVDQKNEDIASMEEFAKSLEPIPSPFN